MNRDAYEQIIKEDIDWLMKQPRTLERDHIQLVLELSPDREYGEKKKEKEKKIPKCGNDGTLWHRDFCEYDEAGICIHCKEEVPF